MPTTAENLKKAHQRLIRLEKSQALQKVKKRKQETRRKIEFGGLVVKARMDAYSKDLILGALLDAKAQIESSPESRRLFEIKGQKAFMEG